MKSHEVLAIIFKGQAKRLADAFGIKETSAAKFLRDPNNSGARNPLDRLCKVFDEAVLANRSESGLLLEYLRQYYYDLVHDKKRTAGWRPSEAANEILETATRAVQALIQENQKPADQLRALVEARHILDEAILQLEILNGEESRT